MTSSILSMQLRMLGFESEAKQTDSESGAYSITSRADHRTLSSRFRTIQKSNHEWRDLKESLFFP